MKTNTDKSKQQVLCIGSAVVDIAARPIGREQSWQEKQRIEDISIHVGGDAVNQSLMLALLGRQVYLSAAVGSDDNGFYLRSMLEMRGVKTDLMSTKPEYHTGTSMVLVDARGERHTFSVHGAHSTFSRPDCPDLAVKQLELVGAISLASLFSMPEFEANGLIEYLQEAKRRGILVFADLASDKKKQGLPGIAPFLPYIDYFLPSEYDALAMTGTTTVEEAADIYLSCGAGAVIIKCGSRGCFYAAASRDPQPLAIHSSNTLQTADSETAFSVPQLDKTCTPEVKTGYAPAISVAPVDTTGAGDAMCALFIHEILNGQSLDQACIRACAGASYTTLFSGASSAELTVDGLQIWIANNIQTI